MDLEQKRARHRQFWQPFAKGEGAYLAVASPIRDGVSPEPLEDPKDLEEYWFSTEYRLKRAEHCYKTTYFGQDAIQREFVNFGPGVLAGLVGAPYKVSRDSIWFDREPPIKDWGTVPELAIQKDQKLYQWIDSQTRALCDNAKGRYTVSFTDIGGQYDVLYSLRGEELLMDLIEYPDEVMAAEAQLDRAFIDYFNTYKNIIGPTGCGYTTWIPLVHDKPWYPIQCDMSVMISPCMFEEFVLPALDQVSTAIGEAVYHLDGPGEIKHLDMILSLPHVHAVQWVPLPDLKDENGGYIYNFTSEESIGVVKRILASGKKVILMGIKPNQIATVFNTVGCDGIFIDTCCDTRKDADELIALAQKEWLKL